MKDLRELLSNTITSKPEVIQFTKDRRFEEAWITPLSRPRPTNEEIDLYLSKEKFEVLIVEYIWNQDDDDSRFVLTIFQDKKCLLQDPKKFVEISLDNFYGFKNFKFLVDDFDARLIGHPYLFTNQAESINISIFNHWLSVGPVELWKSGETLNNNIIGNKIASRPEIAKSKLNYQGLFFRFNVSGSSDGPYYGIKTPCCQKIGQEWQVDLKKVSYWTHQMIEP